MQSQTPAPASVPVVVDLLLRVALRLCDICLDLPLLQPACPKLQLHFKTNSVRSAGSRNQNLALLAYQR